MANPKSEFQILAPLDLKPLSKTWAKLEILFGLAAVFLGLAVLDHSLLLQPVTDSETALASFFFLTGWVLFVLGGYLAMAGHRSHLYQSNNKLTAFLVEEIRKVREKENHS